MMGWRRTARDRETVATLEVKGVGRWTMDFEDFGGFVHMLPSRDGFTDEMVDALTELEKLRANDEEER